MANSLIGKSKWELDTPVLLIDLEVMERNIGRIAQRCRSCGVDWRPHTKASKSPAIAHKFLDAGAIGITCAKLGEAEVMAAAGIKDILVANQIVGRQKMDRLVNLRRHSDVMVAADDPVHISAISDAAVAAGVEVRILIEIDVGLERSGIAPGKPAVELAKQADGAPGIRFAGLMGYEGHAMDLDDPQKKVECEKSMALLADSRDLIVDAGLSVDIVSAGGTGTLSYTPDLPGVTEIQAGGGIFMDTFYRDGMKIKNLEPALTILSTVVSRPTADRAVIDAGRKTTSNQFTMPEALLDGVTATALSAEHGTLALEPGVALNIGDKIELISGYSDMTIFLHDTLYGVRSDQVETEWAVLGRGKLH